MSLEDRDWYKEDFKRRMAIGVGRQPEQQTAAPQKPKLNQNRSSLELEKIKRRGRNFLLLALAVAMTLALIFF